MTDPDAGGLPWPDGTLPDQATAARLVRSARGSSTRLLATWKLLDDQIVRGGHAAWGHRLLGQLLSDHQPLGSDAIPAAAWSAYLVTYAECGLRDAGPTLEPDVWTRAWGSVQAMPDGVLRASLMVRITCGGIAGALATADQAQPLDTWAARLYAVLADHHGRLTAPAHLAPVIAAVLAYLDALESDPDPFASANPWLERLAMIAADVPRGPERALALACVGRLARHRQDVELARRRFDDAARVLAHAPERDLVPCLHWPRGIHVPCSPALDTLRGLIGLEPVSQTQRRLVALAAPSRTLAANRIDALRLELLARVRAPLLGARPSGFEGTSRVLDHDLGLPSCVAHVLVLPRAAALALQAIDAGYAAAGLSALETLAAALDTSGNPVVASAVRAAHLRIGTRLRLPWAGTGEADPGAGRTAVGTPLSRADRHACWRTRHAFDEASRRALAVWGRTYLLPDGVDGEGEWARAAAALDLVECEALGIGGALGTSRLVAPVPEDWWMRHPAQPELAARLWLRAVALGVTHAPLASALVACVGIRRTAVMAEEEGALLALRLPGQALRLLAHARHGYEASGDLPGRWRTAILQALTQVRQGAPRASVDIAGVEAAHDALASALTAAGADPLPTWTALKTRALIELIPGCGSAWVAWLQRTVALHRWCAHGARPEDLFEPGPGLPQELRDWPRQARA